MGRVKGHLGRRVLLVPFLGFDAPLPSGPFFGESPHVEEEEEAACAQDDRKMGENGGERRKTESVKRKRSLPLKKGGKGERPNECVVRGRERIEEGANLLKVFFCSREENESKTLRFCFSFVKGPLLRHSAGAFAYMGG